MIYENDKEIINAKKELANLYLLIKIQKEENVIYNIL